MMQNFLNHSRTLSCLVATLLLLGTGLQAQNEGSNHGNKFEQLGEILPDPNVYRGPDGAPGPEYWQQRADYDIECTLDVENLKLDGKELITYYNQSPHTLRYLWLQLDENEHSDLTEQHHSDPNRLRNTMSEQQLQMLESIDRSKYGHKIEGITTATGKDLKYIINQTMLRIDLPEPLKPGEQFSFYVDWYYYITDRMNPFFGGRGGYEYFEKEDNYIFTITQWYPRLCVYSDVEGWQNKQFTGRGEFALTFGNFIVKMTVPDDHVVGSTGECLNYSTVLTPTQLKRWEQAKTATTEPIEIVTLEEAKKTEKAKKSTTTKTWIYKADNVRDFAWTASRKFVWDALPHFTEDGRRVMCMSYYGKEAYPIYNRYSTKTVAHTLKTYSKYTIPYPYPVAISVEASNGMEYPMICFNYGRAEEDGSYTERAKYGAIGVIIHEVGHNYFPMIINSDERQWTWMDEGINTFLQFLTEQEFDNNYPSRRGPAYAITDYMKAEKDLLEPIMTNSENIVQFGPNAYAKPATALNILRETVMGRELFDYAFKEYSRRWAFKHPTPADFFRSMEDASAVDLDWFWRGWFYTTEAVDISLDSINWFKVDVDTDPQTREVSYPVKREQPYEHISQRRNREEGKEFAVEKDPELVDFYSNYKPWETKDSVIMVKTEMYAETLSKKEKEEQFGDKNYYELFFSNKGGLVMPIILEFTFEDGTTEIEKLPAQIWRKNEDKFSRVFVKDKKVTAIKMDPFRETADIDESNNSWPVQEMPSRFQIFKSHKTEDQPNPMQEAGKVIRP
jgi:hypothetical protein